MSVAVLCIDSANYLYNKDDLVYIQWENTEVVTALPYKDALIKLILALYLYACSKAQKRLISIDVIIPYGEISKREVKKLCDELCNNLKELRDNVQYFVKNTYDAIGVSSIAHYLYEMLSKAQYTRSKDSIEEVEELIQLCNIESIEIDFEKCKSLCSADEEIDVCLYVVLPLMYVLRKYNPEEVFIAFATLDNPANRLFRGIVSSSSLLSFLRQADPQVCSMLDIERLCFKMLPLMLLPYHS